MCAIAATQCGSNPIKPTPPALEIACPAAQTLQSTNGQPVAVSYASPTVAGGSMPTTTACTPISGSMFPVGLTTVMCQATDAIQRVSACSFGVTVTPPPQPPRLSATRFVAFGDSITEGTISLAPYALIPSPSWSYPFKLQNLLVERYIAQTPPIQVLDEGIGGERVATGLARLPGVLSADAPDVLLLMEGVNDLNSGGASAIPTVVDALRSMVRMAKGRGVKVFVGTLLPQRAGAQRAFAVAQIEPANDQIRAMAAAEGAVIADLYQGFGSSADPWIGSDGLHPTEAGMQRIAEIYFDSIRTQLEVPNPLTRRWR